MTDSYARHRQSVSEPLKYYSNNIGSTTVLLAQMQKRGVKTLVFSSSATVYLATIRHSRLALEYIA